MTVSLVSFANTSRISQENIEDALLLNQLHMQRMNVLKQGQWYSLVLNGFNKLAEDYSVRIGALKKKKIEDKDFFVWKLDQIKARVRNGLSLDISVR